MHGAGSPSRAPAAPEAQCQADSAFRIRCAVQSVVADRRSLANRIRCTHACRTPNPNHSSAQHIRPQPWPTQVSVPDRLLKSVAATQQTDRQAPYGMGRTVRAHDNTLWLTHACVRAHTHELSRPSPKAARWMGGPLGLRYLLERSHALSHAHLHTQRALSVALARAQRNRTNPRMQTRCAPTPCAMPNGGRCAG